MTDVIAYGIIIASGITLTLAALIVILIIAKSIK